MLFNKPDKEKDIELMDNDELTLGEYGLTSNSAKAQSPAAIGLALRFVH